MYIKVGQFSPLDNWTITVQLYSVAIISAYHLRWKLKGSQPLRHGEKDTLYSNCACFIELEGVICTVNTGLKT